MFQSPPTRVDFCCSDIASEHVRNSHLSRQSTWADYDKRYPWYEHYFVRSSQVINVWGFQPLKTSQWQGRNTLEWQHDENKDRSAGFKRMYPLVVIKYQGMTSPFSMEVFPMAPQGTRRKSAILLSIGCHRGYILVQADTSWSKLVPTKRKWYEQYA